MKWTSKTLPRRLASWYCSNNFKPDQSGGLARYNPFQGNDLSGKPAMDRKLARSIHVLTWVVSGNTRSGQVRKNHYRAS